MCKGLCYAIQWKLRGGPRPVIGWKHLGGPWPLSDFYRELSSVCITDWKGSDTTWELRMYKWANIELLKDVTVVACIYSSVLYIITIVIMIGEDDKMMIIIIAVVVIVIILIIPICIVIVSSITVIESWDITLLICRFLSRFEAPEMTDNTLVNIYPVGDALYTSTESSVIHRIDKDTLDVTDKVRSEITPGK